MDINALSRFSMTNLMISYVQTVNFVNVLFYFSGTLLFVLHPCLRFPLKSFP